MSPSSGVYEQEESVAAPTATDAVDHADVQELEREKAQPSKIDARDSEKGSGVVVLRVDVENDVEANATSNANGDANGGIENNNNSDRTVNKKM